MPTETPITSAPTRTTTSPTAAPSTSPVSAPTNTPTVAVDLDCNINSKCNWDRYTCAALDECRIDCEGTHVCDYAYFNCPDNYDCYVNMHGADASLYTGITGGNNGSLYVECFGSESCDNTDITCPSFGDCVVTTSGGASLYYSDVRTNENTNTLSITSATGGSSITGTKIYCPPKYESGPQHNCIINISGGTGMISNIKIYALESFTDLSLTCDYVTLSDCWTTYQPELICGPTSNPISSCKITVVNGTNNQWRCRDEDAQSYCQDLTFAPTKAPSNTPTSAPTQPPTASPTQAPSISPTNTPTQPPTSAPSSAPTEAPSISPSNTPTSAPTQPPTASPTQAPSISPTNTPTQPPTSAPSSAPTFSPSQAPSDPSSYPTTAPTIAPTSPPSNAPTPPFDLQCNVNNHCKSVTHYCAQSGGDCHIECDGTSTDICGSSRFYCADDYDCYVYINGDAAASFTRIYGGINGDLYLDCSGYESCYNMIIECPSFGDCRITSSGRTALGGATIKSNENTNILSIISTSGNGALLGSEVHCPEKYVSGSQNNCIINVSGGDYMLGGIDVYAL
eukprot:383965_1